MTNEEIKTKVLAALAAVAPELEPGTLAPGANLRDELDIDSMDALNFLVGLSKAFGIDIPEADYRKLSTLDAIVGYVAARVGKR
ncbi:MAG: acyl carrier protein [Burkholderiales bacterium]|nr:acyl carrier protein [Burkholderiales bacterium]